MVDDKVYLISPDYIRATIVEVTDKMKNEVLGYVTVAQLKVAIWPESLVCFICLKFYTYYIYI